MAFEKKYSLKSLVVGCFIFFIIFVLLLASLITVNFQWRITADKLSAANIEQKIVRRAIQSYIEETAKIKHEEKIQAFLKIIEEFKPKMSPCLLRPVASEIVNRCESEELDPSLVTALIYVESRFNPVAVSGKNAMGLMQVRPSAWKGSSVFKSNGIHCENDLYRPLINIDCGIAILKEYYEESEYDLAKTLYRYNTGSKELNKAPFEIEYINKVLYYYHLISEKFDRIVKRVRSE